MVVRHPEPDLAAKTYGTHVRGGTWTDDRGIVHVHYAGNCVSPIGIPANDGKRLFAKRWTRCRKCGPCLRARTGYWGAAAMRMTLQSGEQGLRTWFGTFTLDENGQEMFDDLAKGQSSAPNADWWDHTVPVSYWCNRRKKVVAVDAFVCDERFRLVCDELYLEMRRYWARLRKAGYRFKYFLVFERHKSGLPHMHFLLHEQGSPIPKRVIQAHWPWGFSNVSIVGGRSKHAAAPSKAAWYVAKYLSKSVQARQLASRGYRPALRACRHSFENET